MALSLFQDLSTFDGRVIMKPLKILNRLSD